MISKTASHVIYLSILYRHQNGIRKGDLVVAQPDAAVGHAEGEHVVQEGLAARVALGRREGLHEHLLEQLQVRLLVERLRRQTHRLLGHDFLTPNDFENTLLKGAKLHGL